MVFSGAVFGEVVFGGAELGEARPRRTQFAAASIAVCLHRLIRHAAAVGVVRSASLNADDAGCCTGAQECSVPSMGPWIGERFCKTFWSMFWSPKC